MRARDGMGGVIETCKDLDFLLKWDVVFMLKMDKVWLSSRGGVKRKIRRVVLETQRGFQILQQSFSGRTTESGAFFNMQPDLLEGSYSL